VKKTGTSKAKPAPGTITIDRVYSVGRIYRRSGTHNRELITKYYMMMEQLDETGKFDVLEALKNGTVSFAEVYGRWANQDLARLVVVHDVIPITRIRDWIWSNHDLALPTKKGYANCVNQLMTLRRGATVADLPDLLRTYRQQCIKKEVGRSFNQTRAVCQSYLRDQYGRHTPIWMAVSNIKTIKVKDRKTGMARGIGEVLRTVKKMPVHGSEFWSMCITGMGSSEYFSAAFDVLKDRVVIHGKKRESRERAVPLVGTVVKPRATYKYLREELKKVQPTWVPYDARRSFAHWCEQAGVPLTRISLYLGHKRGGAGITSLYLQHEVHRYLVEDGQRLKAFLKSASKRRV
jgi:hypothetical protein